MNLELDIQEVQAIAATLGKLPTESGAWSLYMKLQSKLEQETKAPAQEVAPAPAPVA